MTISATTQGLRMGVATSSSRPTAPFDGQVISETDTDSLSVYKGTAWAPVSGLTLITAQTIPSAAPYVTVSGAFSATYDNYKITVSGGVGSTAQAILMTLGSTSAGYYWGLQGADFAGTTSANGASNTSSWRVAAANTTTFSTTMDLMSPNLAKNTAFAGTYLLPTASAAGVMGNTGGFLNDTTQYTAFTLTPSTGTLTGGTIRVYGYANS